MATATTCELEGRTIGIEKARRLRDDAKRRGKPYPKFSCRECSEYVQPHKAGTTGQGPHFEHRQGTHSPNCSLRSR